MGFLSKFSPNGDERANIRCMFARGTFYTASATLVSVPILQVFAIRNGLNEADLGTAKLVMQAAAILGYFIFLRVSRKIDRAALLKRAAFSHLAIAVLPFLMLALSLTGGLSGAFMPVFSLCWALSGFLLAGHLIIYTRVESALFYSNIYGTVYGAAGILFYVVGIVLSTGVKPVLGFFSGAGGFSLIFAVSLLLALMSFLSSRRFSLLKPDAAPPPAAEQKGAPRTAAPRGKTALIISMHALRGIMSGIVFFLVPVALEKYGLKDSDVGYISMLLTAGYLVGYVVIFRLFDRIGIGRTAALGALLQAVPLLCLLLFGGRFVFLAFYFVFSVGDILLAQGIPLGILRSVPAGSIGAVTALRLVSLQAADALTSFLIGPVVTRYFAPFAGVYCVLVCAVALISALTLTTAKER